MATRHRGTLAARQHLHRHWRLLRRPRTRARPPNPRAHRRPILAAFASTFALSTQVLWGNVASSLSGAQTMLAAARPDRAAAGGRIIGGLLDQGVLHGTGDLHGVRPGFVRRSCCLFYRLPSAGVCGDCVLDRAPSPAPRGSMGPQTPGGPR
ncbi:(2Fe-2S)-binding protein [Aeromicrobium sp. A1-2]|uniref:(2Fe-2S)-binding protein n=1 Tax=Aeromicrobium sp. A1-2 TaxID=2107713 RepID=UPI0013C30D94|nr:(2Fe-2S)-binding protein [Aeromicrobium sp. A1-2]